MTVVSKAALSALEETQQFLRKAIKMQMTLKHFSFKLLCLVRRNELIDGTTRLVSVKSNRK